MKGRGNYRQTKQREVILDVLRKTDRHPTAGEIHEMVRRRIPRVSLGTIYRNLEILASCGMIRKIDTGFSQRRFDWDKEQHYHIRCLSCGLLEDAPLEPLSTLEGALEGSTTFEITGHQLEFQGLCPSCRGGESVSGMEEQG
jgi:Fur family ferric uptake transcriptional regulator